MKAIRKRKKKLKTTFSAIQARYLVCERQRGYDAPIETYRILNRMIITVHPPIQINGNPDIHKVIGSFYESQKKAKPIQEAIKSLLWQALWMDGEGINALSRQQRKLFVNKLRKRARELELAIISIEDP